MSHDRNLGYHRFFERKFFWMGFALGVLVLILGFIYLTSLRATTTPDYIRARYQILRIDNLIREYIRNEGGKVELDFNNLGALYSELAKSGYRLSDPNDIIDPTSDDKSHFDFIWKGNCGFLIIASNQQLNYDSVISSLRKASTCTEIDSILSVNAAPEINFYNLDLKNPAIIHNAPTGIVVLWDKNLERISNN